MKLRRRSGPPLATLWAAGAAVLALLPLGSAPASSAPGTVPGGVWTARAATAAASVADDAFLTVATYNIRHALSDAVATTDVQKLADSGADVISMQEMGSARRRAAVRARLVDCAECPFGASMPNGAGPGELPILFRRSELTYVSKGVEKVSDATRVGSSGAGPSKIAPKYLAYIELQHQATGQLLYIINNHAVASVQARDGGPNNKHPERLKLFRQHMAGLRAMIARFEATGAAVVVTGDFNVNYRRDVVRQDKIFPYAVMKKVGVFASYKVLGTPAGGSHGSGTRLIDYVAASESPTLVPQRQRILTGYRSDHRPVAVTYQVVAAPAAVTAVTATPLDRSAQVSWAPDSGAVTSYTVTTVQTGAQLTVPGTQTTATILGLEVGVPYTFVVRATNAAGTGPDSAASVAVTPVAVPPRTSLTAGPRNGAFVTSGRAVWSYVSDLPGSTFGCSLDGAPLVCGPGSVTLESLAQRTHRFSVTATDVDGDVDLSPATRSWTVPLDAGDLARTPRWTLRTGPNYYTGVYAETTTRGAELSRRVYGVRSLALVATTGPAHGSVKVFLDGTLLKQLSLDSAVLHRGRVLRVADFADPLTGKVRVVVASKGSTVRVEGLGVAQD